MAKKNARNTRGKIVNAAWKLFYEQGYLRACRERVHNMYAAGGIALQTALLRRAGGVIAAGKAARNGKCDNIAALAKGVFPVRDIGAGAV